MALWVHGFTMTFLTIFFVFFTEICQLDLFHKINRREQFFYGSLVFTQGACVAITPYKKGSQYYLVHSRARDTEEKPDKNGSRIIIKFEDILEFISHITEIYENAPTMTHYELQFLRIDIKGISKKQICQIIYEIASNNFQQNRCAPII